MISIVRKWSFFLIVLCSGRALGMDLSKRIIKKNVVISESICAACYRSQTNKKLLRCGSCKKACYCNSVCQTQDWNAGHRELCKKEKELDAVLLAKKEERSKCHNLVKAKIWLVRALIRCSEDEKREIVAKVDELGSFGFKLFVEEEAIAAQAVVHKIEDKIQSKVLPQEQGFTQEKLTEAEAALDKIIRQHIEFIYYHLPTLNQSAYEFQQIFYDQYYFPLSVARKAFGDRDLIDRTDIKPFLDGLEWIKERADFDTTPCSPKVKNALEEMRRKLMIALTRINAQTIEGPWAEETLLIQLYEFLKRVPCLIETEAGMRAMSEAQIPGILMSLDYHKVVSDLLTFSTEELQVTNHEKVRLFLSRHKALLLSRLQAQSFYDFYVKEVLGDNKVFPLSYLVKSTRFPLWAFAYLQTLSFEKMKAI